jgi:hypothetical protein
LASASFEHSIDLAECIVVDDDAMLSARTGETQKPAIAAQATSIEIFFMGPPPWVALAATDTGGGQFNASDERLMKLRQANLRRPGSTL